MLSKERMVSGLQPDYGGNLALHLLSDTWFFALVSFHFVEFLEVGKKEPALDALADVIKSKKHRQWQKVHEEIMEKYLTLCVELRRGHLAKEGLYQYKLITQQVSIASLEDSVRFFLRLANEKAEDARKNSQQVVKDGQIVLDVDDLDHIQTPER